jgi:EAL domain-containing protein (putative c-di-GMP-specific phosphodiesterase class I)
MPFQKMTLCPPIQDQLSGLMEKQLSFDETDIHASFKTFRLSSHFQPIYSLPLQRPVGYEALLRAHDRDARAVPPAAEVKVIYPVATDPTN